MLNRLVPQAMKQAYRPSRPHRSGRRSDARTSVRFEPLEARRLFAADALAGGADLQHTVDNSSDVAVEVGTARDGGDDLLIVNNGDGSDFLEADQAGGPHVKVFHATTEKTGDGDVDGADFLIWQREFGSTTNVDAVYSELGSEPQSDPPPTEQVSFNYERIR